MEIKRYRRGDASISALAVASVARMERKALGTGSFAWYCSTSRLAIPLRGYEMRGFGEGNGLRYGREGWMYFQRAKHGHFSKPFQHS